MGIYVGILIEFWKAVCVAYMYVCVRMFVFMCVYLCMCVCV